MLVIYVDPVCMLVIIYYSTAVKEKGIRLLANRLLADNYSELSQVIIADVQVGNSSHNCRCSSQQLKS